MEFALALFEVHQASSVVDCSFEQNNYNIICQLFRRWINDLHPDYQPIINLIEYDVIHRLLPAVNKRYETEKIRNLFNIARDYLQKHQRLDHTILSSLPAAEYDQFICPPTHLEPCPEIERHIRNYIHQVGVITAFKARDTLFGAYNIDPAYYELLPSSDYQHKFSIEESEEILKEFGILALLMTDGTSTDPFRFATIEELIAETVTSDESVVIKLATLAFHKYIIPYWTRFIWCENDSTNSIPPVVQLIIDQINVHLRYLSSQCCVAIEDPETSYQSHTPGKLIQTISSLSRSSDTLDPHGNALIISPSTTTTSHALRHSSICMLLDHPQFTPSFNNHLLDMLHKPRCSCPQEMLLFHASMEYGIHLAEEHVAIALEEILTKHM